MSIPDVIHCPNCFRWQTGVSHLNTHTCTNCGVVFHPVEVTPAEKLAYLKASLSPIQIRYISDVLEAEAKQWGDPCGASVLEAAALFRLP